MPEFLERPVPVDDSRDGCADIVSPPARLHRPVGSRRIGESREYGSGIRSVIQRATEIVRIDIPTDNARVQPARRVIQRMDTGSEMKPYMVDSQSTYATGWDDTDDATTMSLIGTCGSGGGNHAEDLLINYVKAHDLKNTRIVVYLTKSPCTSTSRDGLPATRTDGVDGCTEKLLELADSRSLHITILARNFYQPAKSKADLASIAAVDALMATGRFAFNYEKQPRSNLGKAQAAVLHSAKDLDEQGFVEIE